MRLLCSEQEEDQEQQQDNILDAMNHRLLLVSMKERYSVEIRKAKTKAILNVRRQQRFLNESIQMKAIVESKCKNISCNGIFSDNGTPLIDYHEIVKDSQNFPLDSITLAAMLKYIHDTQLYSKIHDQKPKEGMPSEKNNNLLALLKLILNSLSYIIRYMSQAPFEERIHLSTPLTTELSLLATLYLEHPITNDSTLYFIISSLSLQVIASLAFTPQNPLQFSMEVGDAVMTMCSRLSESSCELQASSFQALKFLMISSDEVSWYMLEHHNALNICQTVITKLIAQMKKEQHFNSQRSSLSLDACLEHLNNKKTVHEAFISECFEIILHCLKLSKNLRASSNSISKYSIKSACFMTGCQVINAFCSSAESVVTLDSLQLALETIRLCLSDELNNPSQQDLLNYLSNLNISQIVKILQQSERLSLKSLQHAAQIISIISALEDNNPYSKELFETAIGKGNINKTLVNLLLKERNLVNLKILRSLFNGCVDFPWVVEEIAQSRLFWEHAQLLAQRSKNNCVIVELMRLLELLAEECILKDETEFILLGQEHINQVTLIANYISICMQVLGTEHLDMETLILVQSQLINALTVPRGEVKILVFNACERVDLLGIVMLIPYCQDERLENIKQQLIDLLVIDNRRNSEDASYEESPLYKFNGLKESDWAQHEMIVDFEKIELLCKQPFPQQFQEL